MRRYLAIFSLIVLTVILAAYAAFFFYAHRDIYSADGYYVQRKLSGGCVVLKTVYRDELGLAPFINDVSCAMDIRNMREGDLPTLEVEYWKEREKHAK